MATDDTCCTIVPYYKIPAGRLEAFKSLSQRFVERTRSESGVLYYGFSFDGDHAHCREGFVNAEGLLAHLANVRQLQAEMLQIAELTRLEVHAPETEMAKLRGPMARLHPQFFILENGFRR